MAEKDEMRAALSEMVRRLNENERRIRTLEQGLERMETSFSTLEERLLMQLDDLRISLERIGNKITDLAGKFTETETNISRLTKELGKTASKAEMKQLTTYLDIVNPITSKFVTKDELERALDQKIARKA